MKEKHIVACAGIALLDHKKRPSLHSMTEKYPGGITPNICAAYLGLTFPEEIKIFATIGDDNNGYEYLKNSSILERIQVKRGGITGISTNTFSAEGKVEKSGVEYGSATDFDISDVLLTQYSSPLLITDLFTLQLSNKSFDLQKIFEWVMQQRGIVALNLAGITKINKDQELFISSWIKKHRYLLFGNEKEFRYINGGNSELVKNSLLSVKTRADKGSIFFLKDDSFLFDPEFNVEVVDEFGAGDCFMGVVLACLSEIEFNQLTPEKLYKISRVASKASAFVLSNRSNRLSQIQKLEVMKAMKQLT